MPKNISRLCLGLLLAAVSIHSNAATPIANPGAVQAAGIQLPVEQTYLFQPGQEWTYSHHPSLVCFKNRLYAMWSNGRIDEDAPGQRVLYCHTDESGRWTAPIPLLGPLPGKHAERVLTASGFLVQSSTLTAYIGQYEYASQGSETGNRPEGDVQHQDTGLWAMTSQDGVSWSNPVPLNLPIVPNHPPRPLKSGRLLLCANIAFPYTDDPAGLANWHMSGIYPKEMEPDLFDDSEGFWKVKERAGWPVGLCEGSFFQTDDDAVHMLLRSGTEQLWFTESRDQGETWSTPAPSAFTDNGAKFYFDRLPDGRFYYIGNPDPGHRGRRNPLVLSLSKDGHTFDTHYILADAEQTMAHPGKYKGGAYAYPHALVNNDTLYVIVSVCKERILLLSVPAKAL